MDTIYKAMDRPDTGKPVYKVDRNSALRVKGLKCPTCSADTSDAEFSDALSVKEFGISGMCQKCQDSVFGE